MKKIISLALILLISASALAGGSIFGGHKTRSSNPDGVSSINVHICGTLSCPDVIIKKGDCGDIPHTSMQYGVCMCDEGYFKKICQYDERDEMINETHYDTKGNIIQ